MLVDLILLGLIVANIKHISKLKNQMKDLKYKRTQQNIKILLNGEGKNLTLVKYNGDQIHVMDIIEVGMEKLKYSTLVEDIVQVKMISLEDIEEVVSL